jgi:hypothetical protein
MTPASTVTTGSHATKYDMYDKVYKALHEWLFSKLIFKSTQHISQMRIDKIQPEVNISQKFNILLNAC